MPKFLTLPLFFIALSWAAKPMEPLANYNVIMVHGASDSEGGKNDIGVKMNVCGKEAYDNYGGVYGSADMMGKYYDNSYNSHGEYEKNRYNITYFLDSAIFENIEIDDNGKRKYLSANKRDVAKDVQPHFSSIYLQRPFLNPAESPRYNARELGDGTWKSSGACGDKRRSLIEEAQEVRAEGRKNLDSLRKNKLYGKLPPSRNILIGHSMGGVVSREYVQGDFYNNDVDKVIALDSPHEGTGALSLLIEMNMPGLYFLESFTNGVALMGIASGIMAISNDPVTLSAGLYSLLMASLNMINYGVGKLIIPSNGFDYKPSDPLVAYINPKEVNNSLYGISNLRERQYKDNLPMMRLLYGTNSMTFTDPSIANGKTLSRIWESRRIIWLL
jgi:hypothetical protein